jgi:predicted negative regulator of RcsB-dependent stress response
VFSWSYLQLTSEAAQVFRLLGQHPGPDIAMPAAASLAGLAVGTVRPLLAELAHAHLIVEHTPGRYTFHDLLRAYATERAHITDSDAHRRAAVHRVLDHYLHTAHAIDRLLDPHRDVLTLTRPQPGVTPENPVDRTQAWTWCEAEYTVLLASVTWAADTGFDTHAWQLSCMLDTFFERRGHWHEWETTAHTALTAARRLGDQDAQGSAYLARARACALLGAYPDAHPHLQHALDIYRQLGDLVKQAHTHCALAWVLEHEGDLDPALQHAQHALDLFQTTHHRTGQARAANQVGWCHAQRGDHQQALTCCQQALQLHLDIGDQLGTAHTWDSLAYAHHHLGQHTQALDCYQRAIALYRQLRNRYYEAGTLARLGDTQHTMGDTDTARATWRHSLDMLDDLRHPDAEPVRTKLAALESGPSPLPHPPAGPTSSR